MITDLILKSRFTLQGRHDLERAPVSIRLDDVCFARPHSFLTTPARMVCGEYE